MPTFQFTLYVFGINRHSEAIIANLRRSLDQEAGEEYELTVCDVLAEPQVAEERKIFATPTLVLTSPPPARMMVGDLSNMDEVLRHCAGLSDRAG